MAIPDPPLQHVTLDATLAAVVVPPLVAAVVAFAIGLREERADRGDNRLATSRRRAATLAAAAAALSLALVLARAAHMATVAPSERFLATHLLRLVRVGSLDINLDLALDPVAALASSVVAFAGCVALALGARPGAERSSHASGALSLALGALLVALLAADAAVLIGALEIALLAVVIGRPGRSMAAGLAGGAIALAGFGIVFWGLGGGWAGGEYTVDFSPHVVAVREGGTASAPSEDDRRAGHPGDALLTLATHPGAIVLLDDARTPILDGDHALRAPFVGRPIASGRHKIRVHFGAGADDFVVPDALAGAGETLTLAWVGPTLSFREIRDALGVVDERGRPTVREAFLGRRIAGLPLADAACVMTLAGALLVAFALAAALRRRSRLLAGAVVVATVWYVAARLDLLFAIAPSARAIVAVAAAAAFVASAVLADRAPALVALVVLGAGAHAAPSGAIVVVAGVLALVAIELAGDERGRFSLGASALVGAPIPLVGVTWGAVGIVDALWGSRVGGALAPLLVAVVTIGAFARAASARRVLADGVALDAPRTSLAIAVAAASIGVVLGVSRALVGERGEPSVVGWLAPYVATWQAGGASRATSIALVWTGAALGGWAYGGRLAPIQAARRDEAAGGEPAEPALAAAARSWVLGFERWVVGGALGGVMNAGRAAAWLIERAGHAVIEAPGGAGAAWLARLARSSAVARACLVFGFAATLAAAAMAGR